MGSISSGEGMAPWEKAEGAAKEERILVSVRVRPLNAKEIEKDDPSDWECVSDTTIIFKNSLPERSAFPTAYRFDLDSSRFDMSEESNNYKYNLEIPSTMKSHLRSISSPTLDEQILQQGREEIVEATHDDSEDHCKEVRCIEIHAISTSRSDEFKLLMSDESDSPMPLTDEDRLGDPAPQSVGDTHLKPAMEQSIDITTGTTDNIVKPCPDASSPLPSVSKVMNSRELALARSRSCKASLMNSSILSLLENVEHGKETPPETFLKGSPGRPRLSAEMLWKQMQKKLSQDDRVSLYAKWGVDLNSKQRKWQLGQRLWTKTDLEHVKESASLVAKLIGFVEQGRAMKEMFGLSFTPQQTHKRSFSWMQ
ncbi:hypothetical protein BHE74_00016911 [Ensete ventricosum]|nr:hypothetical protein BHE74_00016911 [Ensete ventricosum]